MTLPYFWYQVVCWVLIAQMITGFLKAILGLCIPSIEFWLLDGFDLTPWKHEKKVSHNSESVDEDNESEKQSKKSLKNRIKNFFKHLLLFKYQPLGTEGQKYQRLPVFTLNLVVGVILPMKFGIQLARLPLEPCIAACRRQWPLKRKVQRQSGPVAEMDGNNFDENPERRRKSSLVPRPVYAQAESMDLHSNPSKPLQRPVNFDSRISAEGTDAEHTQIREHYHSEKETAHISSQTSNHGSDHIEVRSKPSSFVDYTNHVDADEQSPSGVHKQSLSEQTRSFSGKDPLVHSAVSNVSVNEYPPDKTASNESVVLRTTQRNQKNGKSPLEGRSNIEDGSRSSRTGTQPWLQSAPEQPVVTKQFHRRAEEDSESRGQYFPRQVSMRSVSVVAEHETCVEPRNVRMHSPGSQQTIVYQSPQYVKCIPSKDARSPDQVRSREDNHNLTRQFASLESRYQDVSEDDPQKRDSMVQVTSSHEIHMARIPSQPMYDENKEASEPSKENYHSRYECARIRPNDDDTNPPNNTGHGTPAELRRRSNSPIFSFVQGVTPTQTRWRSSCHVGVKPKAPTYVPWHSRSAAALVHSLDAVESGTLLLKRQTECPATDIIFSTADPNEQAVINQVTSFTGDQGGDKHYPDQDLWCPISVINSSETDSKKEQSLISPQTNPSKTEVAGQSPNPENPLGFYTSLGAESMNVNLDQQMPAVESQPGPNPFSDPSDAHTKPLSDGHILASSYSVQPSSLASPSAEDPRINFHNYLTVMPTVEEENLELDSLSMRRMARKRSNSGVKRASQGSQENASCSRSTRMTHSSTPRAKAYKIVERNTTQMSRLVDSASVGTGDPPLRRARRSKAEKTRKPSRKDGKSSRKKMEGGVLPEENLRPSILSPSQHVIQCVLSTATLPLAISNHANACVNTSNDLLGVQPCRKLAIKRSNSLPSPLTRPKRVQQSVNRALSEPNVTSRTGTKTDVAKFLLLIKWSKEYYSNNERPVVTPVVSENDQLPLVEVHSKELVVRHMSEDVETVVRNFSEHSQLDYCPPSKTPSSDRFEVGNLEEKAKKLPYELEALIHRPLLENVGVLPEPYDPCPIEEILYLKKTTKPPLKPEVNMEVVLGTPSPDETSPRQSAPRSTHHTSCRRISKLPLPLSSFLPDFLPLPDPRTPHFIPSASGSPLPSTAFEPSTSDDNCLTPSLVPFQVPFPVLDDIESDLMHPLPSVLRERYNRTLRNLSSTSTLPLPSRGYYPNYQPYLPWEANQRSIPTQSLPEQIRSQPYTFSMGNSSNLLHSAPSSRCPSRSTLWNAIDPLYLNSNGVFKASSDNREPSCSIKNDTYPSVKGFESILSPHINSPFPNTHKSDNVIRSPLQPQCPNTSKNYSPTCSIIPTWDNTMTASSKSFNNLHIPGASPSVQGMSPIKVLAGLEMATKRAEDLLSRTSPITDIRSNTQEFTTTGPPQTNQLLTKKRPAATLDSKQSEFPFTNPLICLTSEVTKRPDFEMPSTSRNSNIGTLRDSVPASQVVEFPTTPTWLKQDSATERIELASENSRNRFVKTSGRPSSYLPEMPLKETEQLPSSTMYETTPRNLQDLNCTVTVDAPVPSPVVQTSTADSESHRVILANYKELHKQQMLRMRENITNFKPVTKTAAECASSYVTNYSAGNRTGSPPGANNAQDSNFPNPTTAFNMPSTSATIRSLPCSRSPVIALKPAPQVNELCSADSTTLLCSSKGRSHKNLSSLLEKELNLDAATSHQKRKSTRLRKRKCCAALASSSDTAYHKPTRTKTVRRSLQDQGETDRNYQPPVTRLKGPIKVKVRCTRSFSYFTVKERYNMVVPASSTSNSDRR